MPAPAPFKLREWRANEAVVLERNDNYYGDKPKLARVIYRFMKESSAQRLALENGDIDVARNLSPTDLAAIEKNAAACLHQRAEGHDLLCQPQPEERRILPSRKCSRRSSTWSITTPSARR